MTDLITTVPMSSDTLKLILTNKDVLVIVDLSNSTPDPLSSLIYLSNLNIPLQLRFEDQDILGILDAYLRLPTLLPSEQLTDLMLSLLLHVRGVIRLPYVTDEWVSERQKYVDKWLSLVDAMSIYQLYIFKESEASKIVNEFPEDTTDDTVGINFVHLFTHPLFSTLLSTSKPDNVRYYSKYFNDHLFRGNCLFKYWAVPENEVYLLTATLFTNEIMDTETFINHINETTGAVDHVPSV